MLEKMNHGLIRMKVVPISVAFLYPSRIEKRVYSNCANVCNSQEEAQND